MSLFDPPGEGGVFLSSHNKIHDTHTRKTPEDTKRSGTKRRNQSLGRFYFRTGTVVRTTSDNGRDVTTLCQVGVGNTIDKKMLSTINKIHIDKFSIRLLTNC